MPNPASKFFEQPWRGSFFSVFTLRTGAALLAGALSRELGRAHCKRETYAGESTPCQFLKEPFAFLQKLVPPNSLFS